MNCETFRDGLFETLRGRASGSVLEAHASACPACARLKADIEANERVLRSARAPKAPPEVWAAIARAVEGGRVSPFRRLRLAVLGAAAAAALLAIAALVPGSGAARPTLDLVVVEVRPETSGAFQSFLPRYEGSGGLLAAAGGLDRIER
jgi:anti-sigma factor RsiW